MWLVVAALWSLISLVWAAPPIRVLLETTGAPVVIDMPMRHRGYLDGRLIFDVAAPLSWPVAAQDGQLVIDGQRVGRSLTLQPLGGEFVRWGGAEYRGALRVVAEGDSLHVVNVVDLESYLRGVVPAEMQASWPMEALKAQAIAARSYTLSSLSGQPIYDICATTDCQVYRGVAAEHPRADQAIRETEGMVLTYGGSFARTYYHADSGGALASSAEVWGRALPYAIAQQDVSYTTPHRRWRMTLDSAAISADLRARGYELGQVRALRIISHTASGRVGELEVIGSGGRAVFRGPSLTRMLREWGLKSTRFVIIGELTVQGDGWGHGVGMSQHGARALAQAGYSFSQILAFYYPSTQLQMLPYAVAESPPGQ